MALLLSTRSFLAAAALLAAFAATAPRAAAQTYKIDNGHPGYALSYAYPEDLCWLNHLTVSGTATLTSIEAVFGSYPNGRPVTLCVWRDLGGYGDPNQGLLLTAVHTTVRNAGTQLLTSYAIPPTQVTGSFFVGAYLTTDGNWSPATLDPTAAMGGAWFCTGYGPHTFDPTFLGNWSLWPVGALGGVHGVFMLRANGVNGPTPETRCVAKTNSAGCLPLLALSGVPSASAGSGFTLTATQELSHQNGMFVYTLNGVQSQPFGGGTLCIRAPLRRTPVVDSAGTPGASDCSGAYVFDFNAWIAGGLDPSLSAGATVDGQFWSRDPGFAAPDALGLTQAAHFGIAP